jgi:hypothetical protein
MMRWRGSPLLPLLTIGTFVAVGTIPWFSLSERDEGIADVSQPQQVARQKTLLRRLTVDGEAWPLRSFVDSRSRFCLERVIPGSGSYTTCLPTGRKAKRTIVLRGARVAPGARTRGRWDNVYVFGVLGPGVATLKIVNEDRTEVVIPTRHDVFYYVASQSKTHAGISPKELVAKDAKGRVILRERLRFGTPKRVSSAWRANAPRLSDRIGDRVGGET